MKFLASMALAAAAVNAFSTPLEPRGEEQCTNPGRVVAACIDVSGSTYTTDANNYRLSGTADLIRRLTSNAEATETNKADKVSFVAYDNIARVVFPLSDPTDQIANQVANYKVPGGGTDGFKGMTQALAQIRSAGNYKDNAGVIFFTDGHDTILGVKNIVNEINNCKAQGIRVHYGHLAAFRTGGFFDSIANAINGLLNGDNEKVKAEISAAAQGTGGTVATIRSADASKAFLDQVFKNGITNNDGKCGGNNGQSGGPIDNNVETEGLCSNDAKAVFTYSPKSQAEDLAVTVTLSSKQNPVTLNVVLKNEASGETSQSTVNAANAAQILHGKANPGDRVTVTVTPSGADASTCQYSVGLVTKPLGGPVPSISTAPSVIPSETPVQPSSSETPVQPSSSAPVEPSTTPVEPSTTPLPSSVEPSSVAPPPSSAAPSSAVPTAEPSCPSVPAETVTATETVVQTVTAPAPSATPEFCLCKCDAPGAKPFPKVEL